VKKVLLAAILASLGVMVTGCGGSRPPAVADLGTTTSDAIATGSTVSGMGSNTGGATSSSGGDGKTGSAFSVAGSIGTMTAFAGCMRANGEPSFPDPNAQGVISAGSLDRGSAQFQRALQACRKEMPGGGTPSPGQQARDVRQGLALAACMRRNGVSNFPDPQSGSGGALVIRIAPNSGIDPQSAQFQRAQEACRKVSGGKG
jgi:hypothetical protein